uniref:Agmatine deiminase n=1 Tax=Chromera velia CCMP2878 TaxID=1169474 RepID=A0A0G4FGN9_9ALVE|eukprot:Cvel_16921.t1-p1 / transcript=Cvel_16921.t1 / gene=Cvel_16921 / organism=Chromera_velia_CCMP2878 / gene_product=Putative agmatine deiminase, putative / transcript_product=Putative agmatine deiminase, putative / location=Cvel_scaffold1326:361-1541(-) / protein_length=244 / sequence_SO=supercontig / SO=protein_coding / is_pseudo=false
MSASSCMSDEGGEHEGIWMAFRASPQIWGKKRVAEVQADLLKIALTIAKYEPVFMIVSPEDHPRLSSMLQGQEAKPTHKIHVMKHLLDDLWIRDSGAIFTVRGETEGEDSQTPAEASPLRAVKFNFNGWGKKQAHSRDATVADVMARSLGVPLVPSRLVLEGGGIEVDGEGTAIITQSCVLNANRNPKLSKESAETELKKLLGLEKIIWLPGIAGEDITDGHTDFYARFASPGEFGWLLSFCVF